MLPSWPYTVATRSHRTEAALLASRLARAGIAVSVEAAELCRGWSVRVPGPDLKHAWELLRRGD